MKKENHKTSAGLFERFASRVTLGAGSTWAFLSAVSFVIIWGLTGPLFNFSESWQMVINTGTTIITFLMVFLIQKAQNKDAIAIQLKLNELVAAHESASNRLVSVEDMSEEELKVLQKYYSKLAVATKKTGNMQQSHSIDEAPEKPEDKKQQTQ